MKISVTDPISPAIERTKFVLFRPFDIGKWFKLGFCAFLATLGEGGGSPNTTGNFGSGPGGGDGPDFDPVWARIQENLTLIISIVVAVVVVGFIIGLLITWLSSRGKFMFIDGIVHNRGAVVAPWGEYRQEGNSLFWFRFVFSLCCFLLVVLLAGGCLLIAMPSIQAKEFGSSARLALAIGIPLMVLFSLTAGLISLCLTHFVVPIMYLRRIGVMAAWDEFRHELLADRVGTFVLYVLFQIVIGIAIGVLALLAICLTCCLAIVPYLGSVILLPLSVFARSYHLYFLEQFGAEWIFFRDKPTPNPAPSINDSAPPYTGPTNPFDDPPTV